MKKLIHFRVLIKNSAKSLFVRFNLVETIIIITERTPTRSVWSSANGFPRIFPDHLSYTVFILGETYSDV